VKPSKTKKNNPGNSARKGAKTRKQIRFFVAIISILFLNLTLNVVNRAIKSQRENIDAYLLTAIGMIIVVLVFFPAIAMKYYVNLVTEWIWKHTINISTLVLQKKPAIFIVFLLILFILYSGFFWVWFDQFLFSEEILKVERFIKNQ
jgi:hypothetical protein